MQGTATRATLATMLVATSILTGESVRDYPIRPVPFTAVKVEDGFWSPRLETNRKVTVGYDFKKCEETGRIDNFAVAGGLKEGGFQGIYFNDSDVAKVIEGAAYTLAIHPDPELDRYLDDLIAKIAAAQEDDGYLYTARASLRCPRASIAERRTSRLGSSSALSKGSSPRGSSISPNA